MNHVQRQLLVRGSKALLKNLYTRHISVFSDRYLEWYYTCSNQDPKAWHYVSRGFSSRSTGHEETEA